MSESSARPLCDIMYRVKLRDVDFMVEGNSQVLFSRGADLGDVKKLGPLRFDSMYDLKYLLACPIIDSKPASSPLRETSTLDCIHSGWRRGVFVVSGVRRMNEVNARRARLVLGWVTVFGRVYHLGM